jgi:hypothetical protein
MTDLKQKLMKADLQKLINFILSFYERGDKTFRSQLDIFIGSLENDAYKIRSLIRKELKSLLRRDFVDYYEAEGYAQEIDALRCRIMEELREQSPEIALEMLEEIYENQGDLLESVDDSNGFVGNILISFGEDYARLLDEIGLPLQDKVERVFKKISQDSYGIYDLLITQTKEILGKEGFMALRERILSGYFPNKERDYFSVSSLQKIADSLEDVEMFIHASSLNGLSDYDRLHIAQRLLKKNRPQEALEYLKDHEGDDCYYYMRDNQPHYWTLMIETFDALGQSEKAQETRLNWFEKCLDARIYQDILEHASPDFFDSFRQKAIHKAFNDKNVIHGLSFLNEINAFLEMAQFVLKKKQLFEGSYYRVLVPVAKALEETYPLEATLLYRTVLEWVLNGTKAKYYHHAAHYLIACTTLSTRICNWKDVEAENQYHEAIREKHSRKRKFWEEYNRLAMR